MGNAFCCGSEDGRSGGDTGYNALSNGPQDAPQKGLSPDFAGGVNGAFKFDKSKSLRPKKRLRKATKWYLMHQELKTTLERGVADMHRFVKLPPGEDLRDWVLIHVIDMYNEICLLYGTISDMCTPFSCPCMTAGSKFTYLWADGVSVKTPIKVPAIEYVNYLMEWVDSQIETVFPKSPGEPFNDDFMSAAKTIFKRLFRVYAHMYHSHFRVFTALGCEAHLNICFKRFAFFVIEFDLVQERELAPLQGLIEKLLQSDRGQVNGGGVGRSKDVAGTA